MKKLFRWFLPALLLVLAILLLVNYHLVWTLGSNWFGKKLNLGDLEPWQGGTIRYQIPYAQDSDSQYLDLYLPDTDAPAPLFVLVHGGGFISGDSQTRQTQFMIQYFRDRGYACASINYRLGQEAPFPAAVDDVKAAVRYLGQHAEKYGYDASRIAVWGESAGGYLAVMTAITAPDDFEGVNAIGETDGEKFPTPEIKALVDFYGVMDFPSMKPQFEEQGIPGYVLDIANSWMDKKELGFDSFEEFWMQKAMNEWTQDETNACSVNFYASTPRTQNTALRVLVCHGDADITVPTAQSRVIADILSDTYGTDRVDYVEYHGYGHAADAFYSEENLSMVDAFVQAAFQAK